MPRIHPLPHSKRGKKSLGTLSWMHNGRFPRSPRPRENFIPRNILWEEEDVTDLWELERAEANKVAETLPIIFPRAA